MNSYVALLRGINVGGNRKVPKAELHSVFESLGFMNVVVYLNSGNVVFQSKVQPKNEAIAQALNARFGFDIPTLVLSADKIQAIAQAIPDSWLNDTPKPDKSGQKSDVIYLFRSIDSPDILEKIGYNPAVETMLYVKGAILANITRKNQTRYSLLRVVGTPLYQQMTVRNIATAKKLAELVEE